MSITPGFDAIANIVEQRRSANSRLLEEMIAVRDRYNGDYVIPLPSVAGEPSLPPIIPALVTQQIDGVGLRAAAMQPYIGCPAIDGLKDEGVRSREYASIRRKVLYGTWYASKMKLLKRRAYRHIAGYATCALVVVPDGKRKMPIAELRDPLGCYPEPQAPEDLSPPLNVAFVYGRSAQWIRLNFPAARSENGGPVQEGDNAAAEMWNLVEWLDEDSVVLGIVGPHSPECTSYNEAVPAFKELRRDETRTGMTPALTMPRVTLDRLASSVAHTVGMLDLMAKLAAMEILAEEKGIFPDAYAIGAPNVTPEIVSNGGRWADGREGVINLLKNVQAVGTVTGTPSQTIRNIIADLERNFRTDVGLVPQMTGENTGSLRTGRAIDTLSASSIDPRIQEMHELMEAGLPHLNQIIFATYRGWWDNRRFTLFSGWPGDSGIVEFTPSVHLETFDNTVNYPIPGADVQGTTIQLGQLLQAKGISLRTFRQRHPWIDDPDMEGRQIDEEQLEEVAFQGIAQQVLAGQLPIVFLALMEKHRRKGGDIIDAIESADAELRQRQATPVAPGAPEAMPGAAGGPQAMAQPALPSPVGPPEQVQQLRDVLAAITAQPRSA